jgi:shikimate kinase
VTHLVLVGLMGAGKTSVGERCAAALGRPFVDTDHLVELATGTTVADLFATEGEAAFRARERTGVADACASPEPLVIACGGGAVLDADNRRALREHGVVVWLQAGTEELGRRVGEGEGAARPLLRDGASPTVTLARLAELRAPAYEAAAHLVVDTDGLTIDAVTDRVLEEFRTWNG